MKEESKENYINQRTLFVDSLYSHLKKEAKSVKLEYNKFASLANDYVTSGLSESESVELLIVDGLDRDAAISYITMAQDMGVEETEEDAEFSFVFEDSYGNVFSSYDINKTIFASTKEEAWKKAYSMTGDDSEDEIHNILSINKV
jgi:hypothetical protein